MAEFNIERWRLSVLRVRLDLSPRTPRVAVSLTAFEDDRPRTLWTLDLDLGAFGVPLVGVPDRLGVPPELVHAVEDSFDADLPRETALWLRLTSPYGYLGAVPWEEALVPVLQRPVLRVPDRLPVAADFGPVWTAVVAVCADGGSDWAAPYIDLLLSALHHQVPGRLRVHVFADADTTARLEENPHDGMGAWWRLHDPRKRTRTATSTPWSDWIRSGLQGRAVRSLHVVTGAGFDGDEPMLLVSPDPGTSHLGPGLVPVDAVVRLTDSVGAATLSFGSPPDNPSDIATRMIADALGQGRAGPTLCSSLLHDRDGWALAGAHAYLADNDHVRPLPWHESMFLYVQPEQVRDRLAQDWPESPPTVTVSTGEQLLLPGAPPVATPDGWAEAEEAAEGPQRWVAATHRYLESQWAQLAKSARTGREPSDAPESLGVAYDRGAAEALIELEAKLRESREA